MVDGDRWSMMASCCQRASEIRIHVERPREVDHQSCIGHYTTYCQIYEQSQHHALTKTNNLETSISPHLRSFSQAHLHNLLAILHNTPQPTRTKTMPTLRIAILECDTPLDKVLNKYGSYGDIFTALLKKASAEVSAEGAEEVKVECTSYDVVSKQEYPEDLSKVDAILMTGSSKFSDFCIFVSARIWWFLVQLKRPQGQKSQESDTNLLFLPHRTQFFRQRPLDLETRRLYQENSGHAIPHSRLRHLFRAPNRRSRSGCQSCQR